MTDTSKKTVEQKICAPLANYTVNRREIIDITRELVRQRDAMSTALAFLASRGSELTGGQIETIARNALQKDG